MPAVATTTIIWGKELSLSPTAEQSPKSAAKKSGGGGGGGGWHKRCCREREKVGFLRPSSLDSNDTDLPASWFSSHIIPWVVSGHSPFGGSRPLPALSLLVSVQTTFSLLVIRDIQYSLYVCCQDAEELERTTELLAQHLVVFAVENC